MKIYTRSGDDGTTGMIGGTRTAKSNSRIDTYGTVDELNAFLGLAACVASGDVLASLRRLQNELFVIGSHLALPGDAPPNASSNLPELNGELIDRLESEIDSAETELPPLAQFILPGGSELSARLHVGRSVCRRAERLVVALHDQSPDTHFVVMYLNRLSDWLFVMARFANQHAGVADIPWLKPE